MKINDIYESTTAGSIATVAAPMTTQSRNASIYGGKKGGNLLTGKKTNKPYANSISEDKDYKSMTRDEKMEYHRKEMNAAHGKAAGAYQYHKDQLAKFKKPVKESKMKELAGDLKDMDNGNFKKKYGKDKEHMKLSLGDPHAKKNVQESPRVGLQKKVTPMQNLLDEYSVLITFGTQYLDKQGETPEAQQQLLALVQRLQKDKNLIGLDSGKIEANRDNILNHIHQMMTYAIPILQKYLPADKFDAKRKQINSVLTAYNAARQPISEAKLEEDDLIILPGQGRKLKTGFIPHGKSRIDHEVEMAKSDLHQAAKNAKTIYDLIKDVSEEDGLQGWVQEKIIKANDYLNSVREYLEHKQIQEMTGGVIAGGGVGEATDPIAKRITVKKWGGNDEYSWAVLVDGKPAVTGLSKREVPHYKSKIMKKLQDKPSLTGTNIEEGIVGKIKNA